MRLVQIQDQIVSVHRFFATYYDAWRIDVTVQQDRHRRRTLLADIWNPPEKEGKEKP